MRKTGVRGVVLLCVSMATLAMASVADAAIVGSKPILTWQANGTVRSEVISGNIVYIGGTFTAMLPAGSTGAGAVTRNNAAAINLDTGALLPWNPNANDDVRAASTNTSSTTKSWLPVARRPTTCQVSSIRASATGSQAARTTGAAVAVRRGTSPSITRQVQ